MDSIFEGTSHFGRFQFFAILLPLLIAVLAPVHIMGPLVLLYTPKHRCRLPPSSPWSANDSILPASAEHAAAISDFIPIVGNSSEFDTCHYRLNGSVTACSDWIFDSEQFESTLVTELNLVCSQKKLATLLATLNFVGVVTGVLLCGCFIDWLGRRKCLLLSLWQLTLANLAGLFAVSPAYTGVVRFFVGTGILPTSSGSYVMMMELVGPRARHQVAAGAAYCWSLGAILLPLIAMATGSWRGYSLVSLSLTSFALALAHLPYFAPETPRWLLSRGRDSEAAAVVRRMLRMNGAKNPQQLLKDMREAGRGLTGRTQSVAKSMRLLAKSPTLVMRLCIMCCNWFGVSAAFYGITMASKNLPGSIFITTGLLGIAELPGAIFMHLAADKMGRKSVFLGSVGVSGSVMLLLAATSLWAAGESWLIISAALIAKTLATAAYDIIYVWTCELSPTAVRGAVFSVAEICGRIGSVTAPALGHLDVFIGKELGTAVAFLIFSVSFFVFAGFACSLPETRNRPLPETVDDLLRSRRERQVAESEESKNAMEAFMEEEEETRDT